MYRIGPKTHSPHFLESRNRNKMSINLICRSHGRSILYELEPRPLLTDISSDNPDRINRQLRPRRQDLQANGDSRRRRSSGYFGAPLVRHPRRQF
jgi:hypothetical protein